MLALLLILAGAAILIYRYYENERHYWTRKGIPGPPAKWLWGNLSDLIIHTRPRSIVVKEWTEKYGKVYGMHDGQRKQLVISDLRMLEEILTKKFDHFHPRIRFPMQLAEEGPKINIVESRGQHWKRLRALGSPAFSNNAMKQIRPTVEASTLLMIDLLGKAAEKGDEINMLDFFQEFTMDIISKVALGKKDVKMFENPYLEMTKEVFSTPVNNPVLIMPSLFPFITKYWGPMMIKLAKASGIAYFKLLDDVEKAVAKRKNEREAGQQSCGDFIDMFLDAEVDTEEISYGKDAQVSRRLLFDEVVSQCVVFLLAGFETTANSLSYLTHFLANYPDVQQRLFEEIDAVCTDEEISYEQLADLKYTECAIKEALRHFPLASLVVSRTCVKATQVGDFFIEEGTMIQTDTWSLHMDEEVWGKDAKEFRPERWMEDSGRARVAFQAFGEGPRMCLGMRLAFLEEKLAIAHLLRRFRILSSEHTNPIKLVGSLTVSPSKMMIRLERRT